MHVKFDNGVLVCVRPQVRGGPSPGRRGGAGAAVFRQRMHQRLPAPAALHLALLVRSRTALLGHFGHYVTVMHLANASQHDQNAVGSN